MKTVVIGDIHGRSTWKLITHLENADRIIFVGDYFDSFDIKTEEQLNNFLDIIEYKKSSGKEVIMLIGNHDHHYFPEITDTGTSGYQRVGKYQIEPIIDANREHLQIAYQMDEFLFTHAGVSSIFMDETFGLNKWKVETIADQLNEMFKHRPGVFTFNGIDGYGDDEYQTPIWIRPRSLMRANKNTLRKQVIQVVGHTQVKSLDLIAADKTFGNRYYLIDCLGTSGEYLIIQDGSVLTGQTR
jgi:predicted MPP superfamily phosphohydrolase